MFPWLIGSYTVQGQVGENYVMPLNHGAPQTSIPRSIYKIYELYEV